jgi:hypothetical protein
MSQQRTPPTPPASNPPSTGFISVESVLHECRDRAGRSATLEHWSARLKELLDRFRSENKSPKTTKEAQAVERAFALADELIQTVRSEAAQRAAVKK